MKKFDMEVHMITLVRRGYITREQYMEAVDRHREVGGHIGVQLLELGYLDAEKMSKFAKDVLG